MPSYSQNEVVLVRYPFSDLSSSKVRPAIVINAPHISHDIFIVPLTTIPSPISGLARKTAKSSPYIVRTKRSNHNM